VLRRGRQPSLPQALLDPSEAAQEFPVAGLKRQLRIDPRLAGHVDHGEQEVADLLRHRLPPAALQGLEQLALFFLELPKETATIGPVESDAGRLRRDAQRLEEGGKVPGHAGEHRVLPLGPALLHLDLFPLPQDLIRRLEAGVAEDVRMAPHDLVADVPHDRLEVERAIFLGDARLEDDLEEQVAELLAVGLGRIGAHGVQHLVGLLEKERGEAVERLLLVPRASVGTAQAGHDLLEPIHLRHGVLPGIAAHLSPAPAVRQTAVVDK